MASRSDENDICNPKRRSAQRRGPLRRVRLDSSSDEEDKQVTPSLIGTINPDVRKNLSLSFDHQDSDVDHFMSAISSQEWKNGCIISDSTKHMSSEGSESLPQDVSSNVAVSNISGTSLLTAGIQTITVTSEPSPPDQDSPKRNTSQFLSSPKKRKVEPSLAQTMNQETDGYISATDPSDSYVDIFMRGICSGPDSTKHLPSEGSESVPQDVSSNVAASNISGTSLLTAGIQTVTVTSEPSPPDQDAPKRNTSQFLSSPKKHKVEPSLAQTMNQETDGYISATDPSDSYVDIFMRGICSGPDSTKHLPSEGSESVPQDVSSNVAVSNISGTSLLTAGIQTVTVTSEPSPPDQDAPKRNTSQFLSSPKKHKVEPSLAQDTGRTAFTCHELKEHTAEEVSPRDRGTGLLKMVTQQSMLLDDPDRYLSFCKDEELLLTHSNHSSAVLGLQTNSNPNDKDDFYGLGWHVKTAVFETFKISDLHPWQHEMLQEHIVLHKCKRNCIVVAPTSCGKSLVAYILMLRTVFVDGKDCILALPYISLVDEKARELMLLASTLTASGHTSLSVSVYAGPRGRFPVPSRSNRMRTIYVCTFEKAGTVWRNVTNQESLSSQSEASAPSKRSIGFVAIDEFHMIGEGKRGSVLEDLVTNILFWSGMSTRLLALSATVGNPDCLASFLGCGNPDNSFLYRVTRRTSTPVQEHVVVAGGAFPILREDGLAAGKIDFQSGASHGHDVGMDFMQNTAVLGEDPPLLWLRIHQLRLFVERSALVMLPHRRGSVQIGFPSANRIPLNVLSLCEELLSKTDESVVQQSGLSLPFVQSLVAAKSAAADTNPDDISLGAAKEWEKLSASLVEVPDPYASRGDSCRKSDVDTWDLRIVTGLVMDAMRTNTSVIVFCSSKAGCINLCDALTKTVHVLKKSSANIFPSTPEWIVSARANINGHLRVESSGMVNPVLQRGICVGIAFHSAALHAVERKVVEYAFSRKIISVICATTTLSAGVNLPANRVIIREPRIGRDFITCTKYLQMIGRSGRQALSDGTADSYCFVPSLDVGRFQQLVEKHVECVRSQLIHDEAFFRKNEFPNEVEKDGFSGVTRILIGLVDIAKMMTISDLLTGYFMTLLNQTGCDSLEPDEEDNGFELGTAENKMTAEPLLLELKKLIKLNYIRITFDDSINENITLDVKIWNKDATTSHLRDRAPWSPSGKNDVCTSRFASEKEVEDVIASLDLAVSALRLGHQISLPPISLSPSSFASAAAAAYLSLNDAREFLDEAGKMEKHMCLTNPLALLFVSLTADMSKTIATSAGSIDTMLITKELAVNFEQHPDAEIIKGLGVTKSELDLFLRANSKIRKNKSFCDRIKKLWTALYAKELFLRPGQFEELCQRFGFDRGEAIEISSTLASRCANLKNFCVALQKLWWYPPLATAVISKLNDACEDELRPFLEIQHVTRSRAKILFKMGCRSVKDVACIYPPSLLCENIKYLGIVSAVEMIMDARRHLSREVVNFAAEADYRIESLHSST